MTNKEYLRQVSREVLLPHEVDLIKLHIDLNEGKKASELAERVQVRGQSGDDWHDGAFNSLDDIHRRLLSEGHSLKQTLTREIVDYPLESELRVTLGSTAIILQGKDEREIYLVGFGPIYDRKQKPSPVPVSSPMGELLIGSTVGETVTVPSLKMPFRDITVLSIDQTLRPGL